MAYCVTECNSRMIVLKCMHVSALTYVLVMGLTTYFTHNLSLCVATVAKSKLILPIDTKEISCTESHSKVTRNVIIACVCLTEPTPVARHDHERAQASSDDALRPSHWRLFKGARVLVEEGVDTVGRRRTTISHYGLCGKRQNVS